MRRLYDAKELPLYRGKVARNPLQKLLGYPAGSFLASSKNSNHAGARRCIAAFDRHLRRQGHGTVWEEKVKDIRPFLERLSAAGDLPISGHGGLNRTAVLREFGLGTGSASLFQSRAPLLRALLDEYDEKLRQQGRTQYRYAQHEDRLLEALARPDLNLTHGRIVSKRWLSKATGIPVGAMGYTPCLKRAIDQKQAEVDAALRTGASSETVLVGGAEQPNLGATPHSESHGRVFDFTELIPAYGQPFVERLATAFVFVAADLASPKASYLRVRHFLGWLAGHSPAKPDVTSALRANLLPPKAPFERMVLAYREEHMNASNQGTRHTSQLNLAIIEKLGQVGVLPEVSIGRRMRAGLRSNGVGDARPTLAEARAWDKGALAAVEQLLTEQGRNLPPGTDTVAFIETLGLERQRRADLPEALPDAIRAICEERLDVIREAASAVFREWREHFAEGRRLLEAAEPGSKIGDALRACSSRGAWNREVGRLFPRADPELALANLASLVRAEHDGICPVGTVNGKSNFWSKSYAKVGGKARVQRLLLPPRVVVSAVACLYLCESGANVAVALSLSRRALRLSKSGHMEVVGHKARSGGKAIYNTLARRSSLRSAVSAVEAMEELREAAGACGKIKEGSADRLFVHPASDGMAVLREDLLRGDLATIISPTHLASFKILPSMIRPTVLLAQQLRNPGKLEVAQVLAQHKSPTTTMGYVNKLPHKLILAERVREFADSVEVEILATDRKPATPAEPNPWRETGMGVLCRNPKAGAQPAYPKGTSCEAVDRCVSCPQMVVVANPPSIAQMILWRDALAEAEPSWIEDRYDRWVDVWVPWKALCDVVLGQKLARGPLAGVKQAAGKLAREIKESEGFRLPEPF